MISNSVQCTFAISIFPHFLVSVETDARTERAMLLGSEERTGNKEKERVDEEREKKMLKSFLNTKVGK